MGYLEGVIASPPQIEKGRKASQVGLLARKAKLQGIGQRAASPEEEENELERS